MSLEAENVELLRKAYAEWADSKGAKTDFWMSITDNDARLHSLAGGAPDLHFTRPRSGRSEIIDYIEGLKADWEMIFYRVDEYVAQGDRVVAIGSTSWRNKKTGKSVTTPKIDIWRMKSGKIVELSEFYDTARLFEAAQP